MQISGTTRIVGLIADPIGQVRTPQLLNSIFAEHGVDAVAIGLHVGVDGLTEAWRGLARLQNLAGFVVSIPHKPDAAGLCDALGPSAAQAGTVNAVRREADGRLVGETFDGTGFVAGLQAEGMAIAGRRVLLLGSGGAAASIAFALAGSGAAAIEIVNRTPAKAAGLAERLGRAYPHLAVSTASSAGPGADLIVNATSLGLAPDDPLPVDPAVIGSGACVAEALIAASPSALGRAAMARGARHLDGRPMLNGQVMLLLRHILPESFPAAAIALAPAAARSA
ncbi:MAG: shikimate dehydrogenase [Rhizobiales bacterium]|nr:shikimate dehydrogenase [Hyphomicrobiales bacterium]